MRAEPARRPLEVINPFGVQRHTQIYSTARAHNESGSLKHLDLQLARITNPEVLSIYDS